MPKPQKEPLRLLSQQEQDELHRLVKATSERMDVIKRAKVILAVARVFVRRLEKRGGTVEIRSANW